MRKLLFVLYFCILSVSLWAQDFSFSPTSMLIEDDFLFCVGKNNGDILKINKDFSASVKISTDEKAFTGLCSDGTYLYAVNGLGSGRINKIRISDNTIVNHLSLGHSLMAPILVGDQLFVCDRFRNRVIVLDKNNLQIIKSIDTVREPVALEFNQNGMIYVVGHLPMGSAVDSDISARVGIIDVKKLSSLASIKLPAGSTGMRGLALSPNGKWAAVTHILARFQVPTTQIDRGWINTNAVTLIDCETNQFYCSFLLDSVDYGAANPWGISFSDSGDQLFVAVSGTHEIVSIDFTELIDKISNYDNKKQISNRLSFISSISKRIKIEGKGPRNLLFDKGNLYLADYFSDTVEKIVNIEDHSINHFLYSLNSEQVLSDWTLDAEQMGTERYGEYLFNTGEICFQKWQSCASCHPDSRADGLNWDLLNDGIGNPKQTKSMLFSHDTPPVMITGVRGQAEVAVRAGMRYILFLKRPEEEAIALDYYLSRMNAVPSPYLSKGVLSTAAQRGKVLFKKAGCLMCHNGEFYTDGNKYSFNLGTDRDRNRAFDTPGLKEIWRSAPYMYDGRCETIMDILIEARDNNRHGSVTDFSENDLKDLEQYVLSL